MNLFGLEPDDLILICYIYRFDVFYLIFFRLVAIAMEAMDQLLIACHAQTLNLYVESFLKMVQKLLESTEPELQIMATQSVSCLFRCKMPNWRSQENFFLDIP